MNNQKNSKSFDFRKVEILHNYSFENGSDSQIAMMGYHF